LRYTKHLVFVFSLRFVVISLDAAKNLWNINILNRMENHKNSTGFQQFGHLEDKIKRTTMLVNELEDELLVVRKTYSDLSDQRKTLLRDNTILEHKCSLLEDANKLSHAKATEIADRVEYFLELFG
jgi:hypothetical protein